jgi:hypothetical protein
MSVKQLAQLCKKDVKNRSTDDTEDIDKLWTILEAEEQPEAEKPIPCLSKEKLGRYQEWSTDKLRVCDQLIAARDRQDHLSLAVAEAKESVRARKNDYDNLVTLPREQRLMNFVDSHPEIFTELGEMAGRTWNNPLLSNTNGVPGRRVAESDSDPQRGATSAPTLVGPEDDEFEEESDDDDDDEELDDEELEDTGLDDDELDVKWPDAFMLLAHGEASSQIGWI